MKRCCNTAFISNSGQSLFNVAITARRFSSAQIGLVYLHSDVKSALKTGGRGSGFENWRVVGPKSSKVRNIYNRNYYGLHVPYSMPLS